MNSGVIWKGGKSIICFDYVGSKFAIGGDSMLKVLYFNQSRFEFHMDVQLVQQKKKCVQLVKWNERNSNLLAFACGREVYVWDFSVNRLGATFVEDLGEVSAMVWCKRFPTLILLACRDSISSLDIKEKIAHEICSFNTNVTSLHVSPKFLLAGLATGEVQVRDLTNLSVALHRINPNMTVQNPVLALRWHPKKKGVFCIGSHNLIQGWKVDGTEAGEKRKVFEFTPMYTVGSCCWRPGKNLEVLSAGFRNCMHLWDSRFQFCPALEFYHSGEVTGVGFLDNRSVVSVGKDGIICIRDVTASYEVQSSCQFNYHPIDWSLSEEVASYQILVKSEPVSSFQTSISSISSLALSIFSPQLRHSRSRRTRSFSHPQESMRPSAPPLALENKTMERKLMLLNPHRHCVAMNPYSPPGSFDDLATMKQLAKEYDLFGRERTVVEKCLYNQKIAVKYRREEIGDLWKFVADLLSVAETTKTKLFEKKNEKLQTPASPDEIASPAFDFSEPTRESDAFLRYMEEETPITPNVVSYLPVRFEDPESGGYGKLMFAIPRHSEVPISVELEEVEEEDIDEGQIGAQHEIFLECVRRRLGVLAEENDVQTVVSIVCVVGFTTLGISKTQINRYTNSYIELLDRMKLFAISCEIIKYSQLDTIRNYHSTDLRFQVSIACGRCPMERKGDGGTWAEKGCGGMMEVEKSSTRYVQKEYRIKPYSRSFVCQNPQCQKVLYKCVICRKSVDNSGCYCEFCGHGGHYKCLNKFMHKYGGCPNCGR